jgi:hypothetical protein
VREITPCPVHGIHPWLLSAANTLRNCGSSPEEVMEYLERETRNARRPVLRREISDTVRKAFTGAVSIPDRSLNRLPRIAYSPSRLRKFAASHPEPVTAEYLATRSVVPPETVSPGAFLRALYHPGEYVAILLGSLNQRGHLWPSAEFPWEDDLSRLQTGWSGAFFITAPLDGLEKPNHASGAPSIRSAANVTEYRFLLLESDKAPRELWLRALVQLELPIVAITDSGGKSIHALVRIGAGSKEGFERIRSRLKDTLTALGADPQSMSALRGSRLPGCRREETGRLQALLYFNPEATLTSIQKIQPTF